MEVYNSPLARGPSAWVDGVLKYPVGLFLFAVVAVNPENFVPVHILTMSYFVNT